MPKPLLIFILFTSISFSQNLLTGKIKNNKGEAIGFANVLIKNTENKDFISEFVITKKDGSFSYTLQKEYKTLIIEVTAFGYLSEERTIENPVFPLTLNYNLIKDNTPLKEVSVKAQSIPIKIKEDTVTYDPKKFADGSERKVEDILKKLPGMSVETNGTVKYKGKTVESVMLDGDNLFGYNYQLGTKNINVDMLDKVQAIDNFSENPLLKGLEAGEKVAINLKLKKGKTDFSGNAGLGYGFKDRYGMDINGLAVSQKLKAFSNLNYNNIGNNSSPFDYFSYSTSLEQQRDVDYLATKIIPESQYYNVLDASRANINSAWFSSFNAIYRFNKKTTVKTNLFFYDDKLQLEKSFESNYTINNQSFSTFDNNLTTKKPTLFRGDWELKWNTSSKGLLEYNGRISTERIKTQTQLLSNISQYDNALISDNFYLKQRVLYTEKLNKNNAMQLGFLFSKNNIPQHFSTFPSLYYFKENATESIQKSEFSKTFVEAKMNLLGSNSLGKYTVSTGIQFDESPYQSEYYENKTIQHSDFKNDFSYLKSISFLQSSYFIKRKKWTFQPAISLKYFNQKLHDYSQSTKQNAADFLAITSLSISFKLNQVSSLIGSYGLDYESISDSYLYANNVFTNTRTIQKNAPDLEFQRIENYRLSYAMNDVYNQFQFRISANYNKRNNNFFSDFQIDNQFSRSNTSRLNLGNDNYNFDFLIEKYIPLIEATARITSNYSISNYNNILNGSDIRSNQSKNFQSEFFLKTAFDIPINFENIFTIRADNYLSENVSVNKNTFLNYRGKIFFKPNKRWFTSFTAEYFSPNNNKTNEHYWFLDANIRYTPKAKNWDFYLTAKNLLNNKSFIQQEISDYSSTTYTSNLLERYIIVGVNFSF